MPSLLPLARRWITSLKGWTGIKEMDGLPIEGSYRAHQVPAPDVKKNPEHLRLVEDWLRSYHEYILLDYKRYILENGEDPYEITNWQWC